MNLTLPHHFLLALTCLFLAAVPAPALAQSQAAMNREAHALFQKADARLNAVYAKLIATLDDEGKAKLKAAQRAWVAFRDAEAELQADEARGGSMAPMLHEGTREQLTETRTKQLKELLDERTSR